MDLSYYFLGFALLVSISATLANPDFSFGGVDDESNVRRDVSTNLNLSPWELYVLSDLVLKVTMKQCPKVNQAAVKSLHEMLIDSFKQAPRPESQNDEFLPAYTKLVRCLDYILEKDSEGEPTTSKDNMATTVKKDSDDGTIEVQSAETDWRALEATTTTTEQPVTKPEDGDDDESGLLWGYRSVRHWLKEFFKTKREVEMEEREKAKKVREDEAKIEQERRRELMYKRARQHFANAFHGMSKIVQKSCPKANQPEKTFMRKALLDMTAWSTLNQHDTITTALHYLMNQGLLKSINDCSAKL